MVTPVKIRRAVAEDAQFLPDIERSAGKAFQSIAGLEWISSDEVWSAAEHLDWMARALTWVAESDQGELAGFLIAETIVDILHIWEVSVHSDVQGQGIGRQLVQTAQRHGRETGLSALTLTTFRELKFNEQFYAGLGFQTLETDQLSDRLAGILDKEAEEGLPRARRCAMKMPI